MLYTTQQVCDILKVSRQTLYAIQARAKVTPKLGQAQKKVFIGPVRNFYNSKQLMVLRREASNKK